jgi:NTP pyrophosphatase (non-canonical NTP hydrolase)
MDLTKLNNFILLEREKCPWASQQSILDIINEIKGELAELEEELLKNPKNKFNIAEEMADVFSDVMLLLHVAERDAEIFDRNNIIDLALDKKLRRKGWLLDGKQLSREDASKFWYNAKESEKQKAYDI